MATHSDRHQARRPAWRLWASLLTASAVAGCGETQIAPGHRELVLRLATGTSTRDAGIVDRAAAEVDQLKAAGELSTAEEEAFRRIIGAAGAGDWEYAQGLAYALRDGQEPTAEDRERVANRTLPPMKKAYPGRPAP